jgi:hypothetical protein
MKFSRFSKDGNTKVEFDANTAQEAFSQIAAFEEIFENDAAAMIGGKFVGPNEAGEVRFIVRNVPYKDEKGKEKIATYYEKRVISGPMQGYRKEYGLLEDGSGMFPKRKSKDDTTVEHGYNGWYKFIGNKQDS